MSFLKAALLLCFLFCGTLAGASYLQMVSRFEGDRYYLKNNGNESSRNVRPFIRVGNWSKEFEPHELAAGEEAVWVLPLDEMKKGLPRGKSVMAVTIRYQDMNGYAFSVPEIRDLLSENITDAEQKFIGIPMIRVSMNVEPRHHREFRVHYEVENLKDESIKVQSKLWIPEEFQLVTAPLLLELKPKGKTEGSFQVRNEKALEGSFYNLIATFEYQHDGMTDFQSVYGGVNIGKDDVVKPFQFHLEWINWWWTGGILFVLGYIALYFGAILPLRKK